MNITDLLVLMQRIGKMHEQMLKELCRQYDLSLIEAKIIAFLHNNPTKDTAGDIAELRMLSKGNVSSSYGCSRKGMYPRQLIFYVRRDFFQKQQTRRIAGKRIFPCCHHAKMLPEQSTRSSLLFTTICLTDFH